MVAAGRARFAERAPFHRNETTELAMDKYHAAQLIRPDVDAVQARNHLGSMTIILTDSSRLMSLHLHGSRARHRAAWVQPLKSWQSRLAYAELSARDSI